jgi:hypothetical protein
VGDKVLEEEIKKVGCWSQNVIICIFVCDEKLNN